MCVLRHWQPGSVWEVRCVSTKTPSSKHEENGKKERERKKEEMKEYARKGSVKMLDRLIISLSFDLSGFVDNTNVALGAQGHTCPRNTARCNPPGEANRPIGAQG